MILHHVAYIGLCFSSAKMALLASSPYLQRPIKTSFYEINYLPISIIVKKVELTCPGNLYLLWLRCPKEDFPLQELFLPFGKKFSKINIVKITFPIHAYCH